MQAVVHLFSGLYDLPNDHDLRYRHVIQSLMKLIGAKVGVAGIVSDFLLDRQFKLVAAVTIGWESEGERRAFQAYYQNAPKHPMQSLAGRFDKEIILTRSRRQIVDDRRWYTSPHVMEFSRLAGIDHGLYSNFRLPRPGWIGALGLHRAWGDNRPFTQRERTIVQLIHAELGQLHQTHPAFLRPVATQGAMTERMRNVLECLLEGNSEKEVAARLQISRHTVHTYVVLLYRHLEVHTRGELLSRCLSHAPKPPPAAPLRGAQKKSRGLESPAPAFASL